MNSRKSANLTYADLIQLRNELAAKDFAVECEQREKDKAALRGGSLWGVPVIENPHMTKTIVVTRNLTWGERLLSWPWRPLVKQIRTHHTVPSDEVYVINCDGVHVDIDPPLAGFPKRITGRVSMHMHPEAAALLKDMLK